MNLLWKMFTLKEIKTKMDYHYIKWKEHEKIAKEHETLYEKKKGQYDDIARS